MPVRAEDVLKTLKRVIEPTYGVNVFDLGLVYGITVEGDDVTIEMTFPQPDSPLRAETEARVRQMVFRRHPEVRAVYIEYVPEPEWREDFITPEGELQLRNPMAGGDLDIALTEDAVWDSLSHVPDPEVGISIVDLGLVYKIDISDSGDVAITMTLTTPGCPLHDSIEAAVHRVLETRHPDVGDISVNLVWDPPWSTEMISAAGREELGWG